MQRQGQAVGDRRFARGKVEVRVKKRAADPAGIVRIHAGGAPEISGYYLHYKGAKEQVALALERCLEVVRAMDREPLEEPECKP